MYQHGVPRTGWSPCESRGKADAEGVMAKELRVVASNADGRNRDVRIKSSTWRGLPPEGTSDFTFGYNISLAYERREV